MNERVRLFLAQNSKLRAMVWMVVSRTFVISVDENVVTVVMMVTLVTITSLLCLRPVDGVVVVELVLLVGLASNNFSAVLAFMVPSRAFFSAVNFFLSIGTGSLHLVMMNVALS